MTPGARVAMAIETIDAILAAVAGQGPAADLILKRRLNGARFAGSKDRAAVRAHVYDILRNFQALAARCPIVDGRSLLLAWAGPALFDGAGHAPPPVTPAERAWLDQPRPTLTPAQEANLPDWLAPLFERRFGASWAEAATALNQRAGVDLRVNLLQTTREETRAALAQSGIATRPTPLSPWGLRLIHDTHIEASDAWVQGQIEVQDEASQLAALACAVQPGETAIDLCAGAGGKTLALAMGRPGRLIAHDSDPLRLARLMQRASRAGVAVELHPKEPLALAGQGDVVIVDAPCTGSGTWRRNPEGRLRITPETLRQAQELQIALLRTAATLARPGGRLVYAVCSVLAEEGEDVVAQALARDERLRQRPLPEAVCRAAGSSGRTCLSFAPHSHGTDGFFIASFERVR